MAGLSSKAIGTIADGTTYDASAILNQFRELRKRYPGSILVRSDDYSTFQLSRYWVVMVAEPFASSNDANAWCDNARLAPSDCFAKRLSHRASPPGNTVHR